MSRQLDFDRLLEAWIADGPRNLPDRAVSSIVGQLETHKQRGLLWPPGRTRVNRIMLALAGIAAVVMFVAWTGTSLGLFKSTGLAAPPAATNPPTPTQSATPQAMALPEGGGPLAPGQHYVDLNGYRYSFSVPAEGWTSYPLAQGIATISKNVSPVILEFDGLVDSQFQLAADACSWQETQFTAGSSASDLAAALSGLSGFATTIPTDITVSGYAGKRVQITVPSGATFSDCDMGQYQSWAWRTYWAPEQSDDVRVLDLDQGARHLFYTSDFPETTVTTRTEQDAMVESLSIASVPN
jgi:hypothetical protein